MYNGKKPEILLQDNGGGGQPDDDPSSTSFKPDLVMTL